MRSVKMPWLNSLSVKVLLAYVAGVILSVVLLVLAVVAAVQTNSLARMDLAGLAEDLARKIKFDAAGRPAGIELDEDKFSWVYDSLRRETAYRILDDAGNVALLSDAGRDFWPDRGAPRAHAPMKRFDFEYGGVAMHGVTEPVVRQGRTWYFQVAASTRLMTLLHRVAMPLVGTGVMVFSVVLLFAFGLCAFVTLRYTLKPLRDLSDSAAAISTRSLHARLKVQSVPAEISPLVESFNRVLERLERGYRVQQEFLQSAAHELKTPLALIRAQIELRSGGDAGQGALLGDVEYMTRQVQQLLLLAEASEAHNYEFTTVAVQGIAREAVNYLQRMAEGAGVRLEASGDAVSWKADRGGLFTLLKNLLENAIQHAPAGSAVTIEVERDAITVRDSGPGVEASQLSLIFDRFWRGAHRRDHGAGLGLAICQEIALAHGWRLTAERAEPGMRFRVSVR